jgi:phosphotransferase system HPr-like phosphotransfer protein
MDIKLTLITDIYDFLEIAQKHPSDVRLYQSNYSVDGKSILGVFALNLKEKFVCITEDGNYDDFKKFVNKL